MSHTALRPWSCRCGRISLSRAVEAAPAARDTRPGAGRGAGSAGTGVHFANDADAEQTRGRWSACSASIPRRWGGC